MKKIYIYELIDPRTKEPRYIGKTVNIKTRLQSHLKSKYVCYKNSWIKNLIKQNLKPVLNIIDEVNESEWQFWERHYISLYKSWGFNLTNMTSGGEGVKSYKWTEQHKKNLSESIKKAISEGRFKPGGNFIRDENYREKISQKSKSFWNSEEGLKEKLKNSERKKLELVNGKRILSDYAREKMREAARNTNLKRIKKTS